MGLILAIIIFVLLALSAAFKGDFSGIKIIGGIVLVIGLLAFFGMVLGG